MLFVCVPSRVVHLWRGSATTNVLKLLAWVSSRLNITETYLLSLECVDSLEASGCLDVLAEMLECHSNHLRAPLGPESQSQAREAWEHLLRGSPRNVSWPEKIMGLLLHPFLAGTESQSRPCQRGRYELWSMERYLGLQIRPLLLWCSSERTSSRWLPLREGFWATEAWLLPT